MIRKFASNTNTIEILIAGVLGIGLGIYVLVAAFLPIHLASILIFAVLFAMIAAALGQVKKLLLGVILIELPFQFDVYMNYRSLASDLNALPGYNISLTTLCLVILYGLWVVELLANRTHLSPSFLRLAVLPFPYIVFAGLSIFVARDTELAAFEIFLLLQALLLYVYILYAVRSREEVLFVVGVLLVGIALQGVLMMALRAIGSSIVLGPVTARIDPDQRVGGTIGSPNTAASYLIMLLAPALSLLLSKAGARDKRNAVLGFTLGSAGLLLTISRGGWVGFALSMIVLCGLAWRRGWLSIKAPVILSIIAGIGLITLRGTIVARIQDDSGAAYSRIPLNQIAWEMIKDNPLLGVGANNFAVNLPEYVTPNFSQEWITTVHNKYLLVWSETGAFALIAFVWFLLVTLRRAFRVTKDNDPILSPLALGFMAAMTGYMLHMTVDLFHGRPQVQILFLAAGLIAAMTAVSKRGENVEL